MYDPHPDSILRLLGRRDVRVATDQIKIIIDSYHDLRTGYEFAVNPAGVKRDYAVYSDITEDPSWDGVWEAATTVDSLGWTAEFRIPLSQLRYADAKEHTFGFGIWRDIDRFKERDSWPEYKQSDARFMSQLGTVEKIDGIPSPHRLELVPYVVAKNVSVDPNRSVGRNNNLSGGANLKYGLTSNLTLDATVNPDFGQVESDPSVLNLSAFETFFAEQRPFFLEGTGIYSFQVNCNIVNCNNEGLFYSRRIGRSPQLGYLYGDASSPTSTTILGATKLTGRLAGGMSVGVLDAVTQRADGPLGQTLEPTTNYAVVRAQQDLRGGESGIGIILTGVESQQRFVHARPDQSRRVRCGDGLSPSLCQPALRDHGLDRRKPGERHAGSRCSRRRRTRCTTISSPTARCTSIPLARRSPATRSRSPSARWAAASRAFKRRTTACRRASSRTTSATCSAPTCRTGATGSR